MCADRTLSAGTRERIVCGADERQAIHSTELPRRRGALHPRQRRRVPVRAVRGHAREAEREARSGHPPRRPARGRRRVRRLRRRRHRPGAPRPRPRGDARHPHAHAAAVAAERGAARPATCTWRARSGPTARARSCAASSTARTTMGFEFMLGAELEYFLVRMRDDGTIELADPLDTLDQPCYDMRGLTRNLDFVSMVAKQHHRARLGQLRDRPRGRERPVRAELRLRRRAHHLRPLDLLPLHGRVAGPGARA